MKIDIINDRLCKAMNNYIRMFSRKFHMRVVQKPIKNLHFYFSVILRVSIKHVYNQLGVH